MRSWLIALTLLLLYPVSLVAQPDIEADSEEGEQSTEGANEDEAKEDAGEEDAGEEDAGEEDGADDGAPEDPEYGTRANCLGIRDGLLEAQDASYLADAICREVSRQGIPMGKVSEETGGDTTLRLLLTMDQEGEVIADWTLSEAGVELGSGQFTSPNYNAAMAAAPELAKEIAESKHGPNLSEGFYESYYWTNIALIGVHAAGVGEWAIGMSTTAHGQIDRFVIKLSGRFAFDPDGGLFVSDGVLDLGANIISFDDGKHAFYATAGVGLYALLAGADALSVADVANRAGLILTVSPGAVFFRQSPINLYTELRASFPVWEFSFETNPEYIVPLSLEVGVGF